MLTIEIKPEDVDQLVRDAVAKSMVGKLVNDLVTKSLSGHNSPLEQAVQKIVSSVALDLLEAKFKEQITVAIAAAMEAKITKEFLEKVVQACVEKMARDAERY